MPELPDVEVLRRRFDQAALQRPIQQVSLNAERLLAGRSPQTFRRHLQGHRFERTMRHGKYLLARLDSGEWVAMHFGMTGYLQTLAPNEQPPRFGHMAFRFGDGSGLAYVSRRKLGRIELFDSEASAATEHELGPDALDELPPVDRFIGLARGRERSMVKCWLMDQAVLSGIGNVYSDEILFQAGIHPKRRLGDLSDDALSRLHDHIIEVLRVAIEAEADPARMPEHFLTPVRGARRPCPRCGGKLNRVSACGRNAWYCPECQPAET